MHATSLWNIGKTLSLQINFWKTFFKTSKPEILNFIIWSDRQAWKQYLRYKGVPTSLLWFQIRGLKNFSAHANFRIIKRLGKNQILLSWSPLLSIYQNKMCFIQRLIPGYDNIFSSASDIERYNTDYPYPEYVRFPDQCHDRISTLYQRYYG